MKQSILKVGDLVKYHRENEAISEEFMLGAIFPVVPWYDGGLGVRSGLGDLLLVDSKGNLTSNSEYFTKHQCPVVLPIGNQKELGYEV